jgi:hypothetical protein
VKLTAADVSPAIQQTSVSAGPPQSVETDAPIVGRHAINRVNQLHGIKLTVAQQAKKFSPSMAIIPNLGYE